MENENTTPETLPEGEAPQETPLDSQEGAAPNVNEPKDVNEMSLKDINETLGKDFPSKEAALKSIKDTYSYIGKKQEANKSEVDTSNFIDKDRYETDMFFAQHKNYAEYKDVIMDMKKEGQPVQEVVESESFKKVFDKVSKFDEIEQSRSVLQSNPRLGQITDKISDAREKLVKSKQAMAIGDSVASENAFNAAKEDAVNAVLDTFEGK